MEENTQFITKRIIYSGNIYELYTYSIPIRKGYEREKGKGGRSVMANFEQKAVNRVLTMNRAKRDVRRLINANAYAYEDSEGNIIKPVFISFTYKENVTDLKWSNREYSKFIQRLNFNFGYKTAHFKYVTVIEFQERGAIHYHTVFFNLPLKADFVSKEEPGKADALIEAIWKHGWCKVVDITEVDNVGAYLTKYMTKETIDERLVEEKCYFSARGLLKPVTIDNENAVNTMEEYLKNKKARYEKTFESKMNGDVDYKQYNENDFKEEE